MSKFSRLVPFAILLAILALSWYWIGRPPSPEAGIAFKVAMLLPGPIDDQGWSQAGYEGLQQIQADLSAQVAYVSSVPEAEMVPTFRRFATEGHDFIVGHGGEYIPAAETVAREFPATRFAVVARHPGNNRNFGALSFRDGELGYLAGVVAALKTQSKKIGFLGGVDYPHMLDQVVNFERGSKAIDPSVRLSVRWLGNWTDAVKARKLTRDLLAEGADVILVDADQPGNQAFQLIQEAGAYAIGWSVDQYRLAPRAILTSCIQRVPVLLLEGATLVQEGRWEGKQYKFGLKEGAQGLAPFRGMLTPSEEAKVKGVMNDIRLGKIDVNP